MEISSSSLIGLSQYFQMNSEADFNRIQLTSPPEAEVFLLGPLKIVFFFSKQICTRLKNINI